MQPHYIFIQHYHTLIQPNQILTQLTTLFWHTGHSGWHADSHVPPCYNCPLSSYNQITNYTQPTNHLPTSSDQDVHFITVITCTTCMYQVQNSLVTLSLPMVQLWNLQNDSLKKMQNATRENTLCIIWKLGCVTCSVWHGGAFHGILAERWCMGFSGPRFLEGIIVVLVVLTTLK